MTDITQTHPLYRENQARWVRIRDLIAGEDTIKAAKTKYLPYPVSLPKEVLATPEYENQYKIYLDGAHFVNYTLQAIEDLVASVFSREPIIDPAFPPELEYLSLSDVARRIASTVVSYGSALALVDYPVTAPGITKEQEKQGAIAAYYSIYEPLAVINWATERLGGVNRLTRLVILTKIINEEGEYEDEYRELSVLDGVYTITLYDENGEQKGEPVIPKALGQTLTEIPAIFVGVITNDEEILDQSPVQGIADTNLKHYQNTAELQGAINYLGHPMLGITGAPMGFIDAMNTPDSEGNKQRITVGASQALVIEGEAGKAELLQINADLVHFKQLEQLEKSMGEQGYRIKSDKSAVESAQALTIRNSGSTSKLASIATQVEKAIKSTMQFVNAFMGTNVADDFQFELVRDYLQSQPDPQMLSTLDGLVNGGRIPDYVLFNYMIETELLPEDADFETLRADSEAAEMEVMPAQTANTDG